MSKTAAPLGQHFLRSDAAIAALVDATQLNAESSVLEIGPGEGVVTEALLKTGARVVAIEKDKELAEALKARFAKEITSGKLDLVEDDFRNIDISSLMRPAYKEKSEAVLDARRGESERGDVSGNTATSAQRLHNKADDSGSRFSYSVAANIPYYITGEIIRTLLTTEHQPTCIALLIQKEVAERIVARDNKESILSLSVKAYGTPRIVRTVPRGSFTPPPAVDSAVIAIENISRDFFAGFSEEKFFSLVKRAFAQKRKQLGSNLKGFADADALENAFTSCNVSLQTRAEDLSLEEWGCLSKSLT